MAARDVWTYTAEEIHRMPLEEYAKLRGHLLRRAKDELRYKEKTGDWPTGEAIEAIVAAHSEEQERLELREQLRRAQEEDVGQEEAGVEADGDRAPQP